MLIYNTTYHVEEKSAKNFLIWVQEFLIPETLKTGMLRSPRLMEVLSNKEDGSCSFSLQWEVEDSKTLHAWYTKHGTSLNKQMIDIFKDDIVGFPTLLDVIELQEYDKR